MRLFFFLLLMVYTFTAFSQNNMIYEAEDAVINGDAKTVTDSTASENQFVAFGKNSAIKWTLDQTETGWYKIAIRYRAVNGDVAQNITINEKQYGMGFSMTDSWYDSYITAFMTKGQNEITLLPGYGEMEIDYLGVPRDTLFLLPSLSPVNGVFYQDHPSTVTLFNDAKGKKLKKVNGSGKDVSFQITEPGYPEGSYFVTLTTPSLMTLSLGINILHFTYDDGSQASFSLEVKPSVSHSPLTLILFNVEHGNAVLAFLPDGKKLLIDSGKEEYAVNVLMPFFDRNGIDSIDYFIITHYHDDHTGAKDEIMKKYNVRHFYDYKSFSTGDSIKTGGADLIILNTFSDGTDENDRSMSFLLKWNGFTYSHGSDNYAVTQDRILKRFGNGVAADVFYANHHFHGSVNPGFILKTNPALVVVSAEQSVYARGAFADYYREKTEKTLYASHARLKETLLTLETGTVVIRVNNAGNWIYETYRNNDEIVITE